MNQTKSLIVQQKIYERNLPKIKHGLFTFINYEL